MKKLAKKKVPLSLKGGNDKQQKISKFFILPKSANSNEDTKSEESKMVQEKDNSTSCRLLGECICMQCLKKSPSKDSNYCSECNRQGTSSSKVESLKTKLSTGVPSNNGALKGNTLSSPDVIPATPPAKSRLKSNSVKSVKRKFSFENEDHKKRKYLQSDSVQHNLASTSEMSSEFEDSSYKENISVVTEKENIESKKVKNTIHQPTVGSINIDTLDSDNMNAIKNENNSFKNNRSIIYLSKTERSPNTKDYSDHLCSDNFKEYCTSKINVNDNPAITTNIDITNEVNQECVNGSGEPVSNAVKKLHANMTLSDTLIADKENLKEEAVLKINMDNQNTDLNEFDTNFFDDSLLLDCGFKEPLMLDSCARCKVVSVEHLKTYGEIVLALTSCETSDSGTATCVLRGSWANINISVGDTVSVTARQVLGQEGCWVIDNEHGLLVIQPDTLVSGTTVVGSLFCMRRSVLSDMYRGIDSDSPIMVIGSFLHQLLQEVLKRKSSTVDDIKKVLNDFTQTRYFIFNLYSSGMSLEKTMDTLNEFVPKIHAFVQKYLFPKRLNSESKMWNEGDSWRGTITNIADIEENIWAPRLGLKGKIDVTVKTVSRNNKEKVVPLELKTGRASFSPEHRGQVILYTMMMSELGRTVDSGLLLYLREELMKEVPVGAVERRDLILLRNELVTQLSACHRVVITNDQQVAAPVLPPPINHHSACSKCPYLTLCSSALRVNGCNDVSENNPLKQLSESSTSHLHLEHIVYVFHWTGLLRLEHTEALINSPALHHIWTLPSSVRAKRGTCVSAARLVGPVVEVTAGSYQHVFECSGDSPVPFADGEYVIISSSVRPAIAAGPVTLVSHSNLTLLLERDLSVSQVGENKWNLDKYESQSGLVFNMTNLGCLLDNTDQAERLRRAVIELELPQFSPKLSSRVLKASVDLLSNLNDQQRKAIFRALAADHYILIKGMPGTGKTATIVALVQLAVRLGLSVLITSHTHSAVDNVLLRLRGLVDFLRLGSSHKLHPELIKYSETKCKFDSPEDIHLFYNSKRVVGVTCLGSSHALLSRRQFDLCVVDEATQVLQPTVLRPLFSAHKFVLIGDPNQLPPLVRSSKAKELGLGESLFARLDRPAVTTELSLQYRMNQTITDLANTLTYGGKLQCGSPEVATATLTLAPTAMEGEPTWMAQALTGSLDKAVVTLDTGITEAVDRVNLREAEIVTQILTVLTKVGFSDERVGVITPYRAQVEFLRKQTKYLNSLVEVNTVDQYQGRDKDVIIYSCTRSTKPTESDILGDKNRLTVAITRARHKLIILGNVALLRGYPLFDQLFNSLSADCIIPLS